jgi:cell division septal protein FtsQ
MKMRQSFAEWEQAFDKEISLDRRRRASLREAAQQRMRRREAERTRKRGSIRFVLLVLTLILTAAVVTVAMFRTLYLLLG